MEYDTLLEALRELVLAGGKIGFDGVFGMPLVYSGVNLDHPGATLDELAAVLRKQGAYYAQMATALERTQRRMSAEES